MTPDEKSSLEEARAPRTEHVDVLRARASALARAPRTFAQAERGDVSRAIVFSLGNERYALATRHVLRVEVLNELMPLPGAAAPLYGLTQWRGDLLTLLDLRSVLGAGSRGIVDLGRMIVVEGPARRFGILVERLLDIATLDDRRLSALARDESREPSLLLGITDDAVLVIDDDALITRHGTAATITPHHEEVERK